jgi:hypothetical protein
LIDCAARANFPLTSTRTRGFTRAKAQSTPSSESLFFTFATFALLYVKVSSACANF